MAKMRHSPDWSLRNVRVDAYHMLNDISSSRVRNWEKCHRQAQYGNVTACFMLAMEGVGERD